MDARDAALTKMRKTFDAYEAKNQKLVQENAKLKHQLQEAKAQLSARKRVRTIPKKEAGVDSPEEVE